MKRKSKKDLSKAYQKDNPNKKEKQKKSKHLKTKMK